MILDLSHLSDEGVEDVLSITSCPVIASHSNSRAVAGSNRNLTDCQMRYFIVGSRDWLWIHKRIGNAFST